MAWFSLIKRSFLIGLALASCVCAASGAESVSMRKQPDGGYLLQSARLRAAFDANGLPTQLQRLEGGRAAWQAQIPGAQFWWILLDNGDFDLSRAKVTAVSASQDNKSAVLQATYAVPDAGLSVHIRYRMLAAEGDRLRATYTLENHRAEARGFRFYFTVLGGLPRGPQRQIVYPYRAGKILATDTLQFTERPAPGQMWMQFIGYLDGANGLITYPEDRTGFLKFADLWPQENGVRFGWCEMVNIPANGRYSLPYEYVIRPLAAPDGLNAICRAYAAWGRGQRWAASARAKMQARPALRALAEKGIVKMVAFGAVPPKVVLDGKQLDANSLTVEQKERVSRPEQSFDVFLQQARSLEALYGVRPVYRYDGWWGRFDSAYPFVFPVSPRLGGDAQFERFCRENRKEGRVVVLHDNPVQYDAEGPRFNPDHMAKNADGSYVNQSLWSGNRLVVVSPRFAIPDNREVIDRLRQYGATGVFWDVIGAMSPFTDVNPLAKYPYVGRDSFYQSLLSLFASLRSGAPEMIYGTEDGQEQMLPYFDYAADYPQDRPANEAWAPLNELVYGDAFFNAVGIDGNNPAWDESQVIRRLCGATLGADARGPWAKQYSPLVHQVFEANAVLGVTATERMLRHVMDPAGWRASFWPSAVVIGNTAADAPLDLRLAKTPLGSIRVRGLRRNGFVILNRRGEWAAWGAKALERQGKLLFSCSNPDAILVRGAQGLRLASHGFGAPTANAEAWRLACPEFAAALAKGLTSWPDRAPVAAAREGNGQLLLPAPGEKHTLYAKRGD